MFKYISPNQKLKDEIEYLKAMDKYRQNDISEQGKKIYENKLKVEWVEASVETLETKVLALIILQALSLGLIILLFFLISYL